MGFIIIALASDSVPPLCLFTSMSSGSLPSQEACKEGVFGPPLKGEEAEAQRGKVASPRSHSK